MVRLLVELKLRLLRRGMQRAGGRGAAGFVIAWVFSIGVGVAVGAVLISLRAVESDRAAGDLAAITTAVLISMWTIGPLVAGSEGTVDPERFAHLPLGTTKLMPGLLAAAAVGFGGLTTTFVLVGLVIGMAPASPMAIVSIAGAVLLLALCVATSRLVTTALSSAMRTRRMRDVVLFVGPLAGVIFSIGFQLLPRMLVSTDEGLTAVDMPGPVRVLVRLFPSGLPTMAVTSAREGEFAGAIAALLAGCALLAVVLRVWSRSLTRVLTTVVESGQATGRRRGGLLGGPFALLPANRYGAVVAKELRLAWRDPRQRAVLISSAFPTLLPLITLGVLSERGRSPSLVLLAAVPAFVIGAGSTNLYGFDGPAHWTNVAAGSRAPVRADLAAKGTARLVLTAPFVVVASLVLAALNDGWGRVPLALGLAAAATGVTTGLGLVGSVRSPMALPDTPSNPFSTGNAGQGMAAAGSGCVTLVLSGAVVAPVTIAAIAAGGHAVASAGVMLAGIGLGIAAWAAGLRHATRRSSDRQPELLAALEIARAN
jgi:ABC-2 type transport system permease protein